MPYIFPSSTAVDLGAFAGDDRPCRMIDFPNARVMSPCPCLACGCTVPAGAWVVPLDGGGVACSASCIARMEEQEGEEVSVGGNANALRSKARGLRAEAEGLRDEAMDLDNEAERLEHQARKITRGLKSPKSPQLFAPPLQHNTGAA